MNLTEDPAARRSANGEAYPASAGHDHVHAGTGSPEPRRAPREEPGGRGPARAT